MSANRPEGDSPMASKLTYLGQDYASVSLRPIRAAYVIRSEDDLRRCVESASNRWGGIAEPMILAEERGDQELAKIAQKLRADILVDPQHNAESIVTTVGISIESLDSSRMPFRGTSARQVVERHSTAPTIRKDGDLWEWAAVGYSDEFQGDSGTNQRRIPLPDEVGRWQLWGEAPIHTTGRSLVDESTLNDMFLPGLLWITDGSFQDVVCFWNERANRWASGDKGSAVIVPADFAAWLNFPQQLRGVLRQSNRDVNGVDVRSSAYDVAELRRMAIDAGFVEDAAEGTDAPPEIASIEKLDVDGWWERNTAVEPDAPHNIQQVILQQPHTSLRLKSPIPIEDSISGVFVEISSLSLFDVPRSPSTARAFHFKGAWHGPSLRVIDRTQSIFDVSLNVPKPADIIAAFLSDRGLVPVPTDKRVTADSVLARFGAPDVMADGITLDVIRWMTSTPSDRIEKAVKKALGDAEPDADIRAALDQIAQRKVPNLTAVDLAGRMKLSDKSLAGKTLELLTGLGLVKRSLVIDCRSCNARSNISLTSVANSSATCPVCDSSEEYVSNQSTGEPAIHYALNGLLDLAGNGGVLPHIATLARLRRLNPATFLHLSTEIEGLPKKPEVDLLGYMDHDFVAGEVKSVAAHFDEKQVQRDFDVSVGVGATIHIVGCLEPLTPEVLNRVVEHRNRTGLRVLVMDGLLDGFLD